MNAVYDISLKGDELHAKLGGGLPRNGFVLIEAENALGKSILAQRFAYGAIKNGISVSYVSTELPLVGFLGQMNSLNYDIKEALLKKNMKFASLFSSIGEVKFKSNMMLRVLHSKKLFESQVIIIDTLSELLLHSEMDLKDCFDLINFFKKIVSNDRTVIFCVDPTFINDRLLNMLRNVSDVYLLMGIKEQFGNVIKELKVKRFSGASSEVEETIPFKVKAGIGIVVELAS